MTSSAFSPSTCTYDFSPCPRNASPVRRDEYTTQLKTTQLPSMGTLFPEYSCGLNNLYSRPRHSRNRSNRRSSLEKYIRPPSSSDPVIHPSLERIQLSPIPMYDHPTLNSALQSAQSRATHKASRPRKSPTVLRESCAKQVAGALLRRAERGRPHRSRGSVGYVPSRLSEVFTGE